MGVTVDLDEELYERLEDHTEEGESVEDLIRELLNVYETEGTFMQEGYSE